MAGVAEGFEHRQLAGGDVAITHHGRPATTLRGRAARRFLAQLAAGGDAQQLMARVTGDYRRGNERTARQNPRNR